MVWARIRSGLIGATSVATADAVQGDSGRPGVAGDLGGEVAGEVGAVGVVAGDRDGQVLAVVQPHVAGVAGADGDQQGVGGGLVGDQLAEVGRVGVDGQGPPGAVAVVAPGRGEVSGGAQVQGEVAAADLEGGDGGHRQVGRGVVAGQAAQCLVDELDGVFGGRPDAGEGLLDGRHDRGWGGDGAAGASVAGLRGATAPQQHPQGPGQHGSAGQAGEQPRRRVGVVGRGGTRRGLVRCPVRLRRAGGVRCGVRRVLVAGVSVVGGLVAGPGSAGLVPVTAASGAVLPPGTARSCGAAGAGAVLALVPSVPGMVRCHPGRIRSGSRRCRPSAWWVWREACEDLGVAVGVSEAVFGDLAEGVPGPDGVGGTAPSGRAAPLAGHCAGWEG